MAIIITIAAGNPLAGTNYEIAGSITERSSGLDLAIANELCLDPTTILIQAPNVFVNGRMYASLSEGFVDKPTNRKLAGYIGRLLKSHSGDQRTIAMMAFKTCVRHAKHTLGMSKMQVMKLIDSLYDVVVDIND